MSGSERSHTTARGGANWQGFTLLELVMAIAVTAFTLMALLGFLLFIGRTAAETSAAAETLFCAQQKIEELRARAVGGGFSQEGEETLEAEGGAGMVRRWAVRHEGYGLALLVARVECSRVVAGREVRRGLETLLCPGE
jgi:hypothetical protein